jgi:hypothetical protein
MDPVSLVGLITSVGQAADLTVKLLTNIREYYLDVKSAPAESKEIQSELQTVSVTLHSLRDFLKSNPSMAAPQIGSLAKTADKFSEILRELEKLIHPKRTRGFRRLGWPFSKGETNKILGKIERLKSLFSLALNVQQSYQQM